MRAYESEASSAKQLRHDLKAAKGMGLTLNDDVYKAASCLLAKEQLTKAMSTHKEEASDPKKLRNALNVAKTMGLPLSDKIYKAASCRHLHR